CSYHKKLEDSCFKKEKYQFIIDKIVNQYSYTVYMITTKIDNEDWLEDIADYIEFSIQGFGNPGIGQHIYTNYLKHYIANSLPKEKKGLLLKLFEESEEKKEGTDLIILNQIYYKWLKIFPLEISFFQPIKDKLHSTFP